MNMYNVSEDEFLNYITELCDIHATEKDDNSMSFVDSNGIEFGRIKYGEVKEWYIFK